MVESAQLKSAVAAASAGVPVPPRDLGWKTPWQVLTKRGTVTWKLNTAGGPSVATAYRHSPVVAAVVAADAAPNTNWSAADPVPAAAHEAAAGAGCPHVRGAPDEPPESRHQTDLQCQNGSEDAPPPGAPEPRGRWPGRDLPRSGRQRPLTISVFMLVSPL